MAGLTLENPGGVLTPHQLAVAAEVLALEESRRRHLVIYLSGAHAYGFPSPDSDLDLKAAHVESTHRLLGLAPPPPHASRLEIVRGVEIDYTSNELRPVLAAFSKKIFHFGPTGAGTAYKLIYNLLGVIQVASVAEAMVQCEAAGIDLHVAAEAFALGYTGSKHVAHHSAVMAEGSRNQPVGFSGRGRLKDSQYGVQLAEKLGRQAMIGQAASAVFAQMVQTGMGELNDSELIDALRTIAAKRA